MTNVHSPWQCATYLFLFPLIVGFVFAGASTFPAAYSRGFGERGGAIITVIPGNALCIPLWITNHARA